ncbi:MAG: hypothetical protein ACFCVD_07770 [Nodosilinea sp.]
MASPEQVRDFLAHWFQLGKPVVLNGGQDQCLPALIFHQGHYSQGFEACWQRIMATQGQGCYLQGTTQTVAELLSPGWEVTHCARCTMPVAIPTLGMMTLPCPCNDLPTWPSSEVPVPRPAVSDEQRLGDLRRRLEAPRGSGS